VAEQHLHRAQVGAVIQQWVAKAWRRVCGEIGAVIPAVRACALTNFQNICRDIGPPRAVTNSDRCSARRGSRRGLGEVGRIQACASSPNGTSRSLLPLPVTASAPFGEADAHGLQTDQLADRRPLAYISSSMVRSRRPSGVATVGRGEQGLDLRLRSDFGTRSGWRAATRRRVGSALVSFSRRAQR
jgi:hypothetical protein